MSLPTEVLEARVDGDAALVATDFAAECLAAACVLLLGKRLDFTLAFGRAPTFQPQCTFVQIDPEGSELDRTRYRFAGEVSARRGFSAGRLR